MLVTRVIFPAKLSHVYVDWLSNSSIAKSLDNIKGLHFSNFKYKVSYLSIYQSLIHSSVVTDNSFSFSMFSTVPVIIGSSCSSFDQLAPLINGSSLFHFCHPYLFIFFLFFFILNF